MNARSSLLLVSLLASACATTSPKPAAPATSASPQTWTDEQKLFYALGLSIGRSVSVFDLSPEELEFLRAGLYAQVKGETPAVPLEEYGPKFQELAKERGVRKATAEKERGKAFQEKAAQEPGAVRTESGLIYQELRAGTGESPKAANVVKVHYRGTTIDGKEFDSSYKRNEPARFPLNGVIPCWTEGVQKMKVGGKARLVCPSDIAYGERGAPPSIPGGATLLFEVELLEVSTEAPAVPGAH
jgi:FKBP-type peptidyl-prolyl cis-trans isomerase FkpA